MSFQNEEFIRIENRNDSYWNEISSRYHVNRWREMNGDEIGKGKEVYLSREKYFKIFEIILRHLHTYSSEFLCMLKSPLITFAFFSSKLMSSL